VVGRTRPLDELHAANIKVIVDIGGLPAPIWLHHKYPSVNVVNQDGVMLHPAERYLDLHRFWVGHHDLLTPRS
jgi:Beta-galactosidase